MSELFDLHSIRNARHQKKRDDRDREAKDAASKAKIMAEEFERRHSAKMTEIVTGVSKMVEAGDMQDLIVIGRNKDGIFMREVAINSQKSVLSTYASYSGVLSLINQDMIDLAASGPFVMPNGQVVSGIPVFPEEE